MWTIALTRARDAGERTRARLARRGFVSVIAPVTEPRATGAVVLRQRFDAVVATSVWAFAFLADDARDMIAGSPLFVVGARSAEAAARRGLAVADPPAINAEALTERLLARLPRSARVLYLAGADRRDEIELALARAGREVTAVEIYVAAARVAWSGEEIDAIKQCDAALHYSRRSAEIAIALAEAGAVADRFRAMAHLGLSREAVDPLRAWGATRIAAALTPREDALFDELAIQARFV